ncbi:MAG TPA: right-handed parallel beta-helix repeat-containing protein [Dehalococcoidia bacterium]|jgi:CSLREA domain-containing protein|nr:right-handed parallel beta-helix repeat-containing protein [Dehalococcoidia bacterium]
MAGALGLLAVLASSQPSTSDAGGFGVATVNSANDIDDGTCNAVHCSLREAINFINGSPFNNVIGFDLANCPPACTISPQSSLPTITKSSSTINGKTEPDYAGQPLITIDGSALSELTGLLVFTGNSATVVGLNIRNAVSKGISAQGETIVVEDSVISGNGGAGIEGALNNDVQITVTRTTLSGNFFGLTAGANAIVEVSDSVVSGNLSVGIQTAFGNGAESLTISDTTITGNGADGVDALSGTLSITDSVINDNRADGIQTNFVGGPPATIELLRNEVNDNDRSGIVAVATETVTVEDNVVDHNGRQGINASGGTGTTVIGNTVTRNGQAQTDPGGSPGIVIGGGEAVAKGNTVTDNLGPGIFLQPPLSNTTVGGTGAGDGNVITGNSGDGVFLRSLQPFITGVSILGNSIHSNGGLGIDLQEDGDDRGTVTPNDGGDGDDGANHLQNFPVLQAAIHGSLHLSGTINSTPNTDFRLEVFRNDDCDPSGNGEGQEFLAATSITTPASGVKDFELELDVASSIGDEITATLTNQTTNDTSEFSPCVKVMSPPTPTPTPPASPTPSATPIEAVHGDADCSGEIDTDDVIASLTEFAGVPPGACDERADADCDESIDAQDALRILLYVAGVPRNPPAGCPQVGDS